MEPLILMLRGVNVSGATRLPMAAFRMLLEELGLQRVQTYIQSGNAVGLGVRDGLEVRVAEALKGRFGLTVPVFVLGLHEMSDVVAANPYAAAGEADGGKVHIFFLRGAALLGAGLAPYATKGERFHLTERALYLHTPEGFGASALAGNVPRYLKAEMTARNQRSATAILALAQGLTGT